jgi:hypothetical protein
MPSVKSLLPLALLAALALSACNTLENRRSLYTTEKVHGPYTRELEEGTWGNPKTVDEQYAESQAAKRYPKILTGEKKVTPAGLPVVSPDAPLPN